MNRKYTEKEEEWIKENGYKYEDKELLKKFIEEFKKEISLVALGKKRRELGVKKEKKKFKKGHNSWSNGRKMTEETYKKIEANLFKKGHIPKNKAKVGEKRDMRGYTLVKTRDKDGKEVWKNKGRLTYEKKYGEIEKGNMVIFLDGNKENFDIDNLECISKKESAYMASCRLYKKDKELTRAGVKIAKIKNRIKEMERNGI